MHDAMSDAMLMHGMVDDDDDMIMMIAALLGALRSQPSASHSQHASAASASPSCLQSESSYIATYIHCYISWLCCVPCLYVVNVLYAVFHKVASRLHK